MSKVVLEIKGEPKKGDILVFNGKEFESKNKGYFVDEMKQEVAKVEKKIVDLNAKLHQNLREVNEKLKTYHNILQILTKGEE